ncbi:unnamed protein product [Ilex paraguariensis]|uniref:Uncharacterized protein n=1 Tax=Ilex paraguariensis TaxID=185542 RepID=A0ABC8ULN5_9AQUA
MIEPCEATPSTLHVPVESSSLPTLTIDLTLLPDHAPASVDPQADIEASIPLPEPATNEIPIATPIISSPSWPADAKPEEYLTKKRRMETHPAPKRSIPTFRPVLRRKARK